MFDWGLFRLRERANHFRWDGLDLINHFADVEYDWDKNQLLVKITAYPRYKSLQIKTTKGVCGSLIKQMKSHFGVASGFEHIRSRWGIASYFSHKSFTPAKVPETLATDLERITILRVNVYTSATDKPPFQESQVCTSELLKSEVQYFTTSAK